AARKQAADKAAKTATDAVNTAKAATETANKPVTNVPATWSESTATAECAGSNNGGSCTATATGQATLTGPPGDSSASPPPATCSAGPGSWGVGATASASTMADSGQPASSHKNASNQPGSSGTARTSASLDCQSAGCTGKITGDATGAATSATSNRTG